MAIVTLSPTFSILSNGNVLPQIHEIQNVVKKLFCVILRYLDPNIEKPIQRYMKTMYIKILEIAIQTSYMKYASISVDIRIDLKLSGPLSIQR